MTSVYTAGCDWPFPIPLQYTLSPSGPSISNPLPVYLGYTSVSFSTGGPAIYTINLTNFGGCCGETFNFTI